MHSEALLIRRTGAPASAEADVFIRRLQGVLTARTYVLVDYDIPWRSGRRCVRSPLVWSHPRSRRSPRTAGSPCALWCRRPRSTESWIGWRTSVAAASWSPRSRPAGCEPGSLRPARASSTRKPRSGSAKKTPARRRPPGRRRRRRPRSGRRRRKDDSGEEGVTQAHQTGLGEEEVRCGHTTDARVRPTEPSRPPRHPNPRSPRPHSGAADLPGLAQCPRAAGIGVALLDSPARAGSPRAQPVAPPGSATPGEPVMDVLLGVADVALEVGERAATSVRDHLNPLLARAWGPAAGPVAGDGGSGDPFARCGDPAPWPHAVGSCAPMRNTRPRRQLLRCCRRRSSW